MGPAEWESRQRLVVQKRLAIQKEEIDRRERESVSPKEERLQYLGRLHCDSNQFLAGASQGPPSGYLWVDQKKLWKGKLEISLNQKTI